MKRVSFEAFVVLLFCLTVCNIGFCQDKVNAKKFEVEKKYDDKIKKRIKNYRAVELKVADFKNLVKNKHKYQEGANVVLNIDGENVEFRLFENDIIDDNFTLFINGKASKPKKNGVETFAGYAYNNPEYYLRLYISDKIISGYYHSPNGKYCIRPYNEFLEISDKKNDFDKIIIYNAEDDISPDSQMSCGNYFGTTPKGGRVGTTSSSQRVSGDNGCKVLKVAVETDNQFCALHTDNKLQMDGYIYDWFNQVEEVYVRHFNLRIKVCSISYWYTSTTDPYPDNTLYTSLPSYTYDYALGATLNSFGTYWRNNRNSVDRNVVHLLTGKGLTYGQAGFASFGEAYYDGSGQGTVCKFDAQQLHRAFSMSTVVNNVSKTKLITDDIYRNICHEIGHTVGAVDLNSGPTDIMTNLLGKSKNFDGSSISLISGYLNSLTCLSTATNLGYNSLFSLKLDGANIINTPAFVNNGMHSLDLTVTNNNQYLQKTTFMTNNSNVYLYYTSNYGTKFQPNNTSTFSISTSTSNTCYYDFWTTFYALKNGNRIAYPNPSSDNVTIEDPDKPTETLAMKLFDDRGVLIGEYTNENNVKSNDLPNGIYFLHIIHSDNTREVKRIIVNH